MRQLLKRIKSLNRYQKGVLLVMAAMVLVFTAAYAIIISREGIVYHNGAPNDRYTVQYTYFDEWVGLIDEFVDCIRNHKQPKINLRWHRQTIDCMNACYKSIESKMPAKV